MATAIFLTTNRDMFDAMMLMRVLIVKVWLLPIFLTTNRDMVDVMILMRVLIVKVWLLQSLLPPTVIWLMQ